MLSEKDDEGPSVLERMHLTLKKLQDFVRQSHAIIVISGLLAAYGVMSGFGYYDMLSNYGHTERLAGSCFPLSVGKCTVFFPSSNDLKPLREVIGYSLDKINIMVIIFALIIGIQTVMGLQIIRSNKMRKNLKELRAELVRQSYLLNFQTTVPTGASSLAKIMHLCTSVFPELDKEKVGELTKSQTISYRANGADKLYTFDSVLLTNEGNFIVKFFGDSVTFGDIEELVSAVSGYFKDEKVFRVVSVANKYDDLFATHGLVDKMNNLKRKFNIDLIIEREYDYSMIWID